MHHVSLVFSSPPPLLKCYISAIKRCVSGNKSYARYDCPYNQKDTESKTGDNIGLNLDACVVNAGQPS